MRLKLAENLLVETLFDERFLMSLNAIAFRGKMSFTDLASLPRPMLILQVLTPHDLCSHFFRDQPSGESRECFFLFFF